MINKQEQWSNKSRFRTVQQYSIKVEGQLYLDKYIAIMRERLYIQRPRPGQSKKPLELNLFAQYYEIYITRERGKERNFSFDLFFFQIDKCFSLTSNNVTSFPARIADSISITLCKRKNFHLPTAIPLSERIIFSFLFLSPSASP